MIWLSYFNFSKLSAAKEDWVASLYGMYAVKENYAKIIHLLSLVWRSFYLHSDAHQRY